MHLSNLITRKTFAQIEQNDERHCPQRRETVGTSCAFRSLWMGKMSRCANSMYEAGTFSTSPPENVKVIVSATDELCCSPPSGLTVQQIK